MELFKFPNKRLRAQGIKNYMAHYGYDRAVCFSCGNASRELKNAGVDVLDISPSGDMQALRWFTIGDVKRWFPECYDATSGHLTGDCMAWVAREYETYLKTLPPEIYLPTGSGETLVCLKLVFPKTKITAVYNIDAATQYETDAPLNTLVELLADNIIKV